MSRSRVGYACHFTHPKTGKRIEGTYRGRRKVEVLDRMTRKATPPSAPGLPPGAEYVMHQIVYTVPRHIPITFSGTGTDQPRREGA